MIRHLNGILAEAVGIWILILKKIQMSRGWMGGDVEALIWDSAHLQGKFSKEEWKRLCQQGRVNNVYWKHWLEKVLK